MTTKNPKIKVIKRSDAAASTVQPKPAKAEKKLAAREMVSTVKNWVNDFQTRKRDETRAAIEKYLIAKPQTSEL